MSCICTRDTDLAARHPGARRSLRSLLHYQNYEVKVLFEGSRVFLGCTRHETYPIVTFEDDELLICIEGMTYGKDRDATTKELSAIARLMFPEQSNWRSELSAWVLGTDGDFLVFLLHKASGELCILNDALGRLPMFFFASDDTFIASREPRFIVDVAGNSTFDREAISQYLLFGYPLGNKTLFANVSQMEPASIIRAGGSSGRMRIEHVHRHCFRCEAGERKSMAEHAHDLAGLLRTACRNRFNVLDTNVMALSGGMDSRMVLSCLATMDCVPPSATFLYPSYVSEKEAVVAKEIAELLNSEWRLFRIGPAKGTDILELLRIKNGLNFLGMSFSMPLLRMMKEVYGDRMTMITGDGGDKVVRDITPAGNIKNIDGLVDYIIANNQLMPIDVVSTLAKMRASDIADSVRSHVQSYDERDMRSKYVRFIIYERCLKWLFHGEDRNRFAVWPVAPFYSIPFFMRAMTVPFGLKSNYKLFRAMLLLFSPGAARITNPRWDLPVTSRKLRLYFAAREAYLRLPPVAKRFVRLHHGHEAAQRAYPPQSAVVACLRAQLERCSAIADYLSVDAVKDNLPRIDKMGFDHLFTVTSTIEHFACSRSAIEDYSERELI